MRTEPPVSLPSAKSHSPAPQRRRRAGRRAAGQAAGRARIHRRAVMRVGAGHAVEEFVAHRLAGDGGAGVEEFLHRRAVFRRGGLMRREPFRIAAAGALAGDVVHVLDHAVRPASGPIAAPVDRRLEIVRDEAAAIGLRHFGFLLVRACAEIPVENFRAVPGHDALVRRDLLEGALAHGRCGAARRKDKDGRRSP